MHASLFADTHLKTLGLNRPLGDVHARLFMMPFKSSLCDTEKLSLSFKITGQQNNAVDLNVLEP